MCYFRDNEIMPKNLLIKETSWGTRMRVPYRLAILCTHPIQYHAPWFRGLAAHPDLSIHVYFCNKATPKEQASAGFGVAV